MEVKKRKRREMAERLMEKIGTRVKIVEIRKIGENRKKGGRWYR